MQNSVSPKNKLIENYYNSVALDYKLFWNLNRSFAVRIGLWDPSTRSLAQALRHEDEILSKLAGIRPADRVLDAGCGVGGSAVFLAKKFGCFVTGITLSQSQVDYGQGLCPKTRCGALDGVFGRGFQ